MQAEKDHGPQSEKETDMDFCVVIPTKNERGTIGAILEEVKRYLGWYKFS